MSDTNVLLETVQTSDGPQTRETAFNAPVGAMYRAGTTAERPASPLGIGMMFFDTTLGFPVFWDGTQYVDATGAPA